MRHSPSGMVCAAGALLTALILTACDGSSGPPVPTLPPQTAVGVGRHIETVFLIVMENHNWSQIRGSTSAPYINHTLLPIASQAERYYNPPGIHPSLPNYLWLEAGTNFDVENDLGPFFHTQSTKLHLVRLLRTSGISWKAYEQGIPGGSCPTGGVGSYAPKHDPFVYFSDVKDNAPYCIAHIRPFTEFGRDLRQRRVAHYNFITPDLCHDMHDSCSPVNDSVRQGDDFLRQTVPVILHSPQYLQDGALFITWDEGSGGDGPIGMLVLSPLARGHGYANRIYYTHSSTLRTIEEIFGVRPLLRGAGAPNTQDLRDLFRVFP